PAADVNRLRGVLLEVRADDPDLEVAFGAGHEEAPAGAERLVVLRDLEALREVGVPVVLAVEDGAPGDRAVEREAELDRPLDRRPVGHREGAREGEADRARPRVLRVAEPRRAAAEHLRPRLQVEVDLEPDHRLPAHAPPPVSARSGGLTPGPGSTGRVRCDSLSANGLQRGVVGPKRTRPGVWHLGKAERVTGAAPGRRRSRSPARARARRGTACSRRAAARSAAAPRGARPRGRRGSRGRAAPPCTRGPSAGPTGTSRAVPAGARRGGTRRSATSARRSG